MTTPSSLLPSPLPSSSASRRSSLSDSLDSLLAAIPRGGLGNVVKRWLGLLVGLALLVVLGLGWKVDAHNQLYSAYSSTRAPPAPLSPFKTLHPMYASLNDSVRAIDVASQPMPLRTPLKERLVAWAQAPGGRGEVEGELELGGMLQINMESCANVWPSHSSDIMKNSLNLWMSLNRSSIHHHRQLLIDHMWELDEQGVTANYGEGRGIVFTAGNADTLERVLYTLRMMRKIFKSTLPAQIYHFPSERPPADSALVKEANELGAELVEAKGTVKDEKRRKNYHLKAIAMVQCPYREVLYLDSDNVPTRDPTYMFSAPSYLRTRAFFFYDFWKTAAQNPVWAILGVRCRDEFEQEAGAIFIDKKYHLDALLLSQKMLEDWKFWFNFSDGDKDVFRFAFLALRKRWGVPGRFVGQAALPSGTASGAFCGLTMQQYDHFGDPLFIHYNLLKQVPSGIRRGFSWGRTKQLPLFIAPHGELETNKTRLMRYAIQQADDAESPDFDDSVPKVRGFGDVDADMLADADDFGNARMPGTDEIKRRAATERGARCFFHGGYTSALCVDSRYDDPRPDSTRDEIDRLRALEDERLVQLWTSQGLKEGDPGWGVPENHVGENPLGIKWDENQYDIVQWKDDPLLKDFENQIYDLGFVPSAPGF